MQMLMRKKRNMEIAQTIDEALEEYYSEIGFKRIPQWKRQKDPVWGVIVTPIGFPLIYT